MHVAADFVSPSTTSYIIMIASKFLLAVPVVLFICTWKNPPLEKMDHDKIDSLFEKQTKMKEQEAPLIEQKKYPEVMMDDNKLQHEKKFTKVNSKEELIFKPPLTAFSGSLSHDTVFFLVLIHTCGVDVVASISTVYCYMFSAHGLFELALSGILAVYTTYKWKREKAELMNKNAQKDKEKEDVVTTLMEVKAELDNQKAQLKVLLEEVEGEKEENKQQLQSVEQEITEREMTFDKPEELLREKENLLRAQWKLDQTKKDTKRQLLNSEKLMEPIEILVTRIHRMKEDVQK